MTIAKGMFKAEKDEKGKKVEKVYVLDTNIILNDIENIDLISQKGNNIIVIPETVLIELEDKKRELGELGYYSRAFIRLIGDCKEEETKVDKKSNSVVKYITKKGARIHIISLNKYESDIDSNHLKECNDKRIVEVAAFAKQYYKDNKVAFLSLDVCARIFSKQKQVPAQTLKIEDQEAPDFEFYKEVALDNSININNINSMHIKDIVPVRKKETNSYCFKAEDGNSKYAITTPGGIIRVIDEEKDFRGLKVKPVNARQKLLAKAILDNNHDMILVDSKAGTGKTLIALSCIMKLIDSYDGNSNFDTIYYLRNSIESTDKGEEIGFIKGTTKEKLDIYNMSLYSTLEYIAKKELKNKKRKEGDDDILAEKITEFISKYNIKMPFIGELRGMTMSGATENTGALILIDEGQNYSKKSLQTVISRADGKCKIIIIGSCSQIDNSYIGKHSNGLALALNSIKAKNNDSISIYGIDLTKSVRGRFAEYADEVF